jgi:hypothetical protein
MRGAVRLVPILLAAALVLGIDIWQLVAVGAGRFFHLVISPNTVLGLTKKIAHVGGAEVLRVLVGSVGSRLRGVRTEEDTETIMGNTQLIVGQQGGPTNPGAVDARAVGTAKVAQDQQPVSLDDDTMHLGDALVLQTQIALFLATDDNKVLVDVDRGTSIEGH